MLRQNLNQALKTAMRDKDMKKVATIRLILAALKDRDISARGNGQSEGIDDADILAMLGSMVKQRRDSIAMYEQGGRLELAAQEQAEIDVITSFLPRQLSDEEVAAAVDAAIADLNADGLKFMGQVMAALREKYTGQMDFGKVSGQVKDKLKSTT
jgi:uncharacterized protein YqeY